MKKIALALLFCTLLACSNSDSSSSESSFTYKTDIMATCPNGSTTTYEVTKTTYDNLESQWQQSGGSCLYVNFKDIHNTSQKGYLKSVVKYN